MRPAPEVIEKQSAASTTLRISALDGLRGIAALIVVVHHALLAVPSLAQPYYTDQPVSLSNLPAWLVTHTPLHLVWAGTEAVYVFFVLSGLVLALPVLGRENYPWHVYYPRRLVRLYLPVVAAVIFGSLLAYAVSREADAGLSVWLQRRPDEVTAEGVARDLTLVEGVSRVISPLWSLQWEVLFSLALPLYMVLAWRASSAWLAKAVGIVGLVAVGNLLGLQFLQYLPMFAMGVLLAANLERLRNVGSRLRTGAWWTVLLGSAVLCSSYWLTLAVTSDPTLLELTRPLILVGATGLVLVAACWPAAGRVLCWGPIHWIGTISFSLYLVHEPLVIALGFLLGPGNGLLVLVLGVPVSLLAGWAFFVGVEKPSHRLARRVGAAVTAR